jgi:hypothetical protein
MSSSSGWSAADNSGEKFSEDDENSCEREEREQLSDHGEDVAEMSTNALNDTLQKSARTNRVEIVQTAEAVMEKVSTDPDKNKTMRIKKHKQKKKVNKKKKELQNVWLARRIFLEGNYASVQEDSDKAGVLYNLSLRAAASNVALSILRSSKHSISFYPMGLSKKGNTVCTFSTSKLDSLWWSCTQDDVDAILKKWETLAPSGTPLRRRKPVHWNEAGTFH